MIHMLFSDHTFHLRYQSYSILNIFNERKDLFNHNLSFLCQCSKPFIPISFTVSPILQNTI